MGLLGVVNVILLLTYFLEANKISLSLSLGFPTLGFSLAGCLNLCVLHGCVIVVHCVYSAAKVLSNVYFCS